MQEFRKSSIVFKKPNILSRKLKTLTSSKYHGVEYFLLKFCTRSYLPLSGIFFILLRSWVIFSGFYTLTETIFINTQDINKIKKSWTSFHRHCSVGNVCQISAKNIKPYGSWSSSKFSIFQQITWFLDRNGTLKKSVPKNQFYINHASHLNWNNKLANDFCIWVLFSCGNCHISIIIGNFRVSILSSTTICFKLILGNISMRGSWLISVAALVIQAFIICLAIVSLFHWLQKSIAKFILWKKANLFSQSLFD